jgi:hypothetical protein
MNSRGSSLRGFGARLWRPAIFLPAAFGLFALFCYAGMGLLARPIRMGWLLGNSQWFLAAVGAALWMGVFVCIRRIWRWERSDDSSRRGRV